MNTTIPGRLPHIAFSVLASFLVVASHALAQGTSAEINGAIRDASGAVVPGAQITATNVDTQAQRKTASGADGGYVVPLLPPGNYRLSVEKVGFQPVLRSGISVEVDQVATIELVMQVGSVTQAVKVVAASPLLAVTNPTLGEDRFQNQSIGSRPQFHSIGSWPHEA